MEECTALWTNVRFFCCCCCYFNKNVAVEAVWFREGRIPTSLSLSLGIKSFLGVSVFPFSDPRRDTYSMWLV